MIFGNSAIVNTEVSVRVLSGKIMSSEMSNEMSNVLCLMKMKYRQRKSCTHYKIYISFPSNQC